MESTNDLKNTSYRHNAAIISPDEGEPHSIHNLLHKAACFENYKLQ